MHAITHSLPHRAPSAARAKVRWQPYNAVPTSQSTSCITSPSSSHFSTPSSSVTSPPSTTISADFHDAKLPPTQPHPEQSQPQSHPRDNNRHKYIAGLVDQAVKTLCEIWRPQDIPAVFSSPSRSGITTGVFAETSFTPRSSHRLHVPSHFIGKCPSSVLQTCHSSTSSDGAQSDSKTNLTHIRGFVHEVLRRSRTPGVVLQTALCYLEAIRPQVADLAQKEHLGLADSTAAAAAAVDDDMRLDATYPVDNTFNNPSSSLSTEDPSANTFRIPPQPSLCQLSLADPSSSSSFSFEAAGAESAVQESLSSSPTHLPCPLLCPRRTFLASLILASKFTLDKCYSNRAWAKLSGLPAREIGRCERALGEALDWRLWVGKLPVPASAASSPSPATSTPQSQLAAAPPAPTHRPVVRSQSDGNILNPVSMRSPFLVRPLHDGKLPASTPVGKRALQRSSTLPADSFAMPAGPSSSSSWPPIPDLLPSKPAPQIFRENTVAHLVAANSFLSTTLTQSPSPDNPGLSYSPSTTDSPNGGERTVQCNFLDESSAIRKSSSLNCVTEQWPWLDTPRNDGIKVPPPLGMNTLHNDMAKLMGTPDYSGVLGSLGSELHHGHGQNGFSILQDYRNWTQDSSDSTRPCSVPVL